MTEDNEKSENEKEFEPTPEDVADELFESNFEERREENLAHAEFEDCELIRQAGNLYQESEFTSPAEAIVLVSEGLALDQEEATRLLSIYTRIFTEFSGYASGHADTAGREFFSGRTIEVTAENNDRTREEAQEDVVEFVGAYIREHDVDEIDLDQSLPNNPYRPYQELFESLPDMDTFLKGIQFDIPRIGHILPLIKPEIEFPVAPIIENFSLQVEEMREAILPTLGVFEEANVYFDEEFIEAISTAASSPPDNWESYSVIEEIDEEELQKEPEDRESYEEQGAKAVAQLGNVDTETARELYLTFWSSTHAGAAAIGSRISDGRIAAIAAITTILFLYTGNIPAAMGFLFIVLNKVSSLSPDDDPAE
ncbi:hypothetical protein [Natronocalculus amylovorans]|uniref:Uncharacterized protein n=1 Tax=Natronocalculus amylovorans TaxID=2917812 RepID=A0AAE3K963_9EURY|nr:hypothetical protein [Natronocalculus amylovorans]MCL9817753.1 hypothetical protein [Natronocalculus amylovorans]